MRVRVRLRTIMIALALLAGLLGTASAIERRVESFNRLAPYHVQAGHVLIDAAGGPPLCGTGLTVRDFENFFCARGPDQCRAYRAACYHFDLAKRYRGAAKHPWLPAANDPQPPPGAFPRLKSAPVYPGNMRIECNL
jgi:hypothetical protein